MIELNYMTTKTAAEEWNITQRRVLALCEKGRIDGLVRVENIWLIPKDAKKPVDARTLRRGKGKKPEARPFVKWAGGKGQLLETIRQRYPAGLGTALIKYAEPFVGGGAVLFDILNHYSMKEVFISDTNAQLINAFRVVKENIEDLISILARYQADYIPLGEDGRKQYYYAKRDRFNELKAVGSESIEGAALFIFLNRTCFNGLYRVNRHGQFNVPIGLYKKPRICDEENLRNASKALQNVEIVWGDYRKSAGFIDETTFVYFDPPYRPLTATAEFTAYTEDGFTDSAQAELARFADDMSARGAKVLLSNSDPKNSCAEDNFFDDLYASRSIERVDAVRAINSNRDKRGKIKELLISNYGKGMNTAAINTHGGGARTNEVGLRFEQAMSLDNALKAAGYTVSPQGEVMVSSKVVAISAPKYKLYSRLLKPKGIDWKKYLTKRLLPDDALYVYSSSTLYIIEKKFQHKAGSVDEKLQTCAFKKKQYQKLFSALGYHVEYIYVCNDWFEQDVYSDVRDYVRSVGCHIYFNAIPLDFLGLPAIGAGES